jgi:bacterioferritin-associated ferredoxin
MASCSPCAGKQAKIPLAIASWSHKFGLANQSQERPSMYICICNAIRESDLRAVARITSGCAETAYAALGKHPNCGNCLCEAEEVLAHERNANACPAMAA